MIVYRDRRRPTAAAPILLDLLRDVERMPVRPRHDEVVRLLVLLGMLESGVADVLHPVADDEEDIGRALRHAAVAAGHLLRVSWRGEEIGAWRDTLRRRLAAVDPRGLPARVEIELPEGYAQYGLYPECHLESAERCVRDLGRGGYVVLGLRSVGTSLSAVVAAALEAHGCTVRSWTVRPRGHPFERRPVLGPVLAAELRRTPPARILVVDEGPGISGSSIAGTAEALSGLGVADEHIVLLPGWNSDGSGLRSERARARWVRHRRFVTEFDDLWLRSGRLANAVGGPLLRDVSAGRWRDVLLRPADPRPAVHPQHERRKFVSGGRLAAFAGLAGQADRRFERAARLAEAGLGPAPIVVADGFLVRELASGTPLLDPPPDRAPIDAMARYLAHLRLHFTSDDAPGAVQLERMIDTNVAESLGEQGSELLRRHRRAWGRAEIDTPVALDGRMLPHEWLRGPGGLLKVDALDHHDDHFFPGPCDIAWDLAAAAIEFRLDATGRARLLARYRRDSGDGSIASRLPAFTVAYLAFRLGYATLASETLGEGDDGRRFEALAATYRSELGDELAATAASRWSA